MIKTIIADSCALILLAKCTILEILVGSFTVIIPTGVFCEVVSKKLVKRYIDAKIVSDLVSTDKIKVVPVEEISHRLPISMDKGEAEALMLARQTANSILATDDGRAIKGCKYLSLPFIVSPKIITELYRLDRVDFAKVKTSIEKLRIIGRYSPDIIAEAILELEVLKDVKTHNG